MKREAQRPRRRTAANSTISSIAQVERRYEVTADVIGAAKADEISRLYHVFPLPKKGGGERRIEAPKPCLKHSLRLLLQDLYARIAVPRYLTGSIPGRSIFDHARRHVRKDWVCTYDIKNFFPSIASQASEQVLWLAGIRGPALSLLTKVVTIDGRLPQGAPTSPFIANVALSFYEQQLLDFCTKKRISITRYIDDYAFSANRDIRHVKSEVMRALDNAGCQLAPGKSRMLPRHQSQTVLNLVVNDQLRPTRQFVSNVRAKIHECLAFSPAFVADHQGVNVAGLRRSLNGRIAHVAKCDLKLAKGLRGKMCGVDWSQEKEFEQIAGVIESAAKYQVPGGGSGPLTHDCLSPF